MANYAAMTGSLVDARNIGTHKSLKITLHIPQEMALAFFERFGWPTAADPIPVVIYRPGPEGE